jgi:hypothetical protein
VAVVADEYLPAALDRLYEAVGGLIDPRKELHAGALLAAPSLYEQLGGEIAATAARGETCGAMRSMPPVWMDAMDLRGEIDDAVVAWQPGAGGTPSRLRRLAARPWRPQDTRSVDQIAGNLDSWTVQIGALLEPQHVKHFSVPCPACGATTVYRRDSAGERGQDACVADRRRAGMHVSGVPAHVDARSLLAAVQGAWLRPARRYPRVTQSRFVEIRTAAGPSTTPYAMSDSDGGSRVRETAAGAPCVGVRMRAG